MGASIENKILDILNKTQLDEAVEYEVVGGPTPSETLKGPLDYAKNVQAAKVPTAPGAGDGPVATSGAGTIGSDDAESNDDMDDLLDIAEDEDKDADKADDEDDKEDDIEETYASLLASLAEADEDDGGTPTETLPDVDSKLDSPDELVTKAPGGKVAESEDEDADDADDDKDLDEDETSLKADNGGTPTETLPDVDSKLDSPDELVTKAPGGKVAESEDEDDKEKKDDVSEDIKAIFSGTKISEKTQAKAALIFKAAVARRVNEEKVRVRAVATTKLKEAYAKLKASTEKKTAVFESNLTGQVDQYLNYVVENWMKENRLAVERGIRAELAEDFIKGLKNLFVEHYIEVPESKVDVVATLGKKVTKLESKLNEEVALNVKLRASVNAYRKEEIVRVVGAGLVDTQKDKLKKLSEGVEYTTRKEFAEKLIALKESYFPKAAKAKKEEPLTEAAKGPAPSATISEMTAYTATLSKFKKD